MYLNHSSEKSCGPILLKENRARTFLMAGRSVVAVENNVSTISVPETLGPVRRLSQRRGSGDRNWLGEEVLGQQGSHVDNWLPLGGWQGLHRLWFMRFIQIGGPRGTGAPRRGLIQLDMGWWSPSFKGPSALVQKHSQWEP